MKKEYNAYIYKTTNLINDKIYIGQCRRLECSKRYLGGGKLIKAAIKKYGKENFKKEIIVQGTFNKHLLDELEKHYIRLYNANNKNKGYNLTSGGEGIEMTEEIRNKIGKSNSGKVRTQEMKDKVGAANRGRKNSPEEIERKRQAGYNRRHTPEELKKMSTSNLGRKQPQSMIDSVRRKVFQVSLSGEIIKEWISQQEAAKELNISGAGITGSIKGKYIQHKGFFWVRDLKDIDYKLIKYNQSQLLQNRTKALLTWE